MSTSHAALGAAVDDRKARLAKLKTLKRKQPADEIVAPESERSATPPAPAASKNNNNNNDTSPTAAAAAAAEEGVTSASADVARLHLSGRNYDAEARGAKLGFEAPPTLGLAGPTLEEQAAAVAEEARRRGAEDAAAADKGIDLFRLQPRKPNWDLKRDLDRKLEVLNVRTDNAIARLVRERIAGAQAQALDKKKKKNATMTTTAAAAGQVADGDGEGEDREGEAAGMDGVALVEGLRVREREEEEEERREREEEKENDVE